MGLVRSDWFVHVKVVHIARAGISVSDGLIFIRGRRWLLVVRVVVQSFATNTTKDWFRRKGCQ
jgi:hypothetical protein